MKNRMTVHREGRAIYDIVLESSFEKLGAELELFQLSNRRVCVVSDSHVAPLYMEQVCQQLNGRCKQADPYVFPAGEEHKNLDTVRDLYEFLILHHYDRNDLLIALGGGVVGDLCGFTAATYLRGIRFIQVPTTLLSQVDSSIGGKTGVDFDAYKNMVGAFHMPLLVYTNTATLRSLSEEQYFSGMGEILKHGLIRDREYYDWLICHHDEICDRDLEICAEMILRSDRIKRDVVEEDPTERGVRALLNFGHTLGHAIEKLMNFELLHGQCVALGCVAACYLSTKRGDLTMEQVHQIRRDFRSFHLPVSTAAFHLDPTEIVRTTKSDKKMDSDKIRFILLRCLGEAFVDPDVTNADMLEALNWLEGAVYEG